MMTLGKLSEPSDFGLVHMGRLGTGDYYLFKSLRVSELLSFPFYT